MTIKSFRELTKLRTFEERYEYLKLGGKVGEITFGYDRYVNQLLYRSKEWRKVRNEIIIRDDGCDLGVDGYEIKSGIIIHHINPLSLQDIEECRACVFDPENLICVSHSTHQAIHYSNDNLIPHRLVERRPNDTCPWKFNRKEAAYGEYS